MAFGKGGRFRRNSLQDRADQPGGRRQPVVKRSGSIASMKRNMYFQISLHKFRKYDIHKNLLVDGWPRLAHLSQNSFIGAIVRIRKENIIGNLIQKYLWQDHQN